MVMTKLWFLTFENHNLDLTNSFWSWPFHFGCDQIIMGKSKSIWSDQNHLGPTKTGHIEGQGISHLYLSHYQHLANSQILIWDDTLRRRLAITRSTSVDYMGLENPLTMSSLYLILTSIIFPVLAISWLCCIALCIYKGLLKNLRLRPGRNTKVQVIFSLCWLYTWLCCIFLCIYKGLLKILRLGPCRSTRVQVMFYL